VRERYVHTCLTAVDFDPCIEVLRERLDEGCPKRPSPEGLRHQAFRSHYQTPQASNRSVDLVADDDPTVWPVFGKCVFQSVDHELGDDKAEADGFGGQCCAALTRTCSVIGRLSPIIEAARLSHSLYR